jgi:hypothetical protein
MFDADWPLERQNMQVNFSTPCAPDHTVGERPELASAGPGRAAAPPSLQALDDPQEANADQALASAAADKLTVLLQQFRQRIDDRPLPLPDPKVVRWWLFSVSKPAMRRSKRIAAKGKVTAS